MTRFVLLLAFVLAPLASGCSDDSADASDAALTDGSSRDAAASPDAGAADAESEDATTTDSNTPVDATASADADTRDADTRDANAFDATTDAGPPPTGAITRGGTFFGFAERFNRYYTDPTWTPARTVYVSADGTGDGSSPASPAPALDAPSLATPGTKIVFQAGLYDDFCIELGDAESGTYDAPIVLFAERTNTGGHAVHLNCCASGRQTCINLEFASYVAIDGFEIQGGNYGVRAVGSGYDASEHSRGIAVLNTHAFDQFRDPLFSGQSDWAVWEKNVCHGAGAGDGHGIYLSNGSDWNIVRFNELFDNASSDFQINADPLSTCADEGVAYDDPLCDAYAGTGEGGRGASDYMFIESNFFHHGNAQGANFTSVRRSVVRNNIFAIYARHGVSFWQETDNPLLGSSDNQVHHNLFVASNNRQMVQFINNSTRNDVRNNLFVGVSISGATISANPTAVWIETDATVSANTYSGNYYISGQFGGDAPHSPNTGEATRADFDPAWFTAFPAMLDRDAAGFAPSASAPFLGFAARLPEVPDDREAAARTDPTDPGPFER